MARPRALCGPSAEQMIRHGQFAPIPRQFWPSSIRVRTFIFQARSGPRAAADARRNTLWLLGIGPRPLIQTIFKLPSPTSKPATAPENARWLHDTPLSERRRLGAIIFYQRPTAYAY